MKILLVSATELEIAPLITHFNIQNTVGIINGHELSILITGVGMTATAFSMGKALSSQQYDLAINCGIAGAFDRSLQIGEVVNISLDCFSELGAESDEDFITIDELGFGKSSIKPNHLFEDDISKTLKKVRSITVNKVHGNDESIYLTSLRLNPQTESMEGAAFFYGCNQAQLPCLQLRAISNYVERRNRDAWNIPLSVKNLKDTLTKLLTNLP